MQVRILESVLDWEKGKPFGVELIAENEYDKEIIRRFNEGGIHNLGITNDNQKIRFSFADLIGT